MNYKFRDLRADEIDVRIGTVKDGGVSLLLYKDARCDMNILDETVGPMNWQRQHCRDNANCIVSLWDEDKGQWISKEDTGTVSNTEAEKGLASDSFKRACFNWGIGRELYSAPFIWITGAERNAKFWVKDMKVEDKKITSLIICHCDKYGNKTENVAYTFPRRAEGGPKVTKKKEVEKATPEQVEILAATYKGDNLSKFLAANNITSLDQTPKAKAEEIIKALEERAKAKKGA